MTDDHPAAAVPEKLFDDPAAESRWRSRFTAARLSLPEPARDDPNHAVYVSNASGTFELVTWDVASRKSVPATDRPDGTTMGVLSADGKSLWWFDDHDGDEFGIWRNQPFGSGPVPTDAAAESLHGVASGYPAGVEVGTSLALAGFSDDDGTRIHLAAGGGIRTVYRHEADGGVGALSTDESIWVLSHSEHGDSRYPALRAYAIENDAVLGDLDDTPGKGLTALEFSPVRGDQRLLVGHERSGRDGLGIWDVSTGEFTELAIDLPGDIDGSFYPDGTALVVLHTHHGRSGLFRFDLGEARLTALPAEKGVITAALARPDGSVWYRHSSATHPPRLLTIPAKVAAGHARPAHGGSVLLAPPHGKAALSEPLTDQWVDGPGGSIHVLLAHPPSSALAGNDSMSLPTVFMVHGGPAAADDDSFDALRAAYLDAGIAVCQLNYRGSTGYGSAWRDALTARVGHTELADIAAVQDHLTVHGLVDPRHCAITGHSWGGYLTLLALGAQPSRWACGVAGVPVADYVTAYADEMEPMRAYDRALFGGAPEDKPLAYEDSSPLSWAPFVEAPVLVFAGENDPRCPIRQIDNYLDALARLRKDYAVYRFNAGHGSMVVAERMRQVATEIAFVREHLLPA
jgi:dienelactone hydrolase